MSTSNLEPVGTPTVQEVADTLAAVQADLDGMRRDLGDLAEHTATAVDALTARQLGPVETSTTIWCWRGLDPLGQHALWAELLAWVGWLRGRYPLGRRLPGCWWRHPELIEDLTALWTAWRAAYTDPTAAATAGIDWHDRWLPGLIHRVSTGPFALDCADGHHDRSASSYTHQPVDDPPALHRYMRDMLHPWTPADGDGNNDGRPFPSKPTVPDLTLLDGADGEPEDGEPS